MKLNSISRLGLTLVLVLSVVLSVVACGGGTTEPTQVETNLSVQSDVVTGSGCFQTNYAHRGELTVWRVRVVDPVTGQDMGDSDLSSVVISLPDGQEFNAHYGDHGDDAMGDTFWAVAWEVPLSYPLGALTYEVEAEAADGRTGYYGQFLVAPSVFQIKEYDPNFVARQSVNIKDNLFDPAVITVTQGGAVRWTNQDQIDHGISGDGFEIPVIAPGAREQVVFPDAGTFEYTCSIHPAETGTVVVQAP